MDPILEHCPLGDLGVLRIGGADARAFLQGQLSNDLKRLDAARPLHAGLHSPQGRVLALLRLWPAPDSATDVLALLPSDVLAATVAHLRRFVLRARVTLVDASADWQALGLRAGDGALSVVLTARATPGRTAEANAPAPAANAATADVVGAPPGSTLLTRDAWEALEIAAGRPEVHNATAGEFVAQMLNLDRLDAIAWDKGCYTGQEIIARAHYRGQVKRRMRRFAAALDAPPAPGSMHRTSDGVEARVVRSVRLATGGCELLAVAPSDAPSVDERPLPYS